MPSTNAVPSETSSVTLKSSSLALTKVIVWDSEEGSRSDLETLLRVWESRGWEVQRRAPRTIEGPAYGELIVLRRESKVGSRIRRGAFRRGTLLSQSPIEREAVTV